MAQMMPSVQARNVDAGISGSSKLATAERTSGYGESSSAVAKNLVYSLEYNVLETLWNNHTPNSELLS